MRMQTFIVGLLFFIASSIVVLSFVFDMYGTDGYDINLEDDTYTAQLSDLQEKANQAQIDTSSTTSNIWDKTPGQIDAEIEGGEVSEGDMIKSSIRALTNIGDYMDVFQTMMKTSFSATGLGTGGAIYWFFLTAIILMVGFLLVSSVLRNIL